MKIYTDNTCIFDMTSSSGGKFDLKIGKIFKKLYSLEVQKLCYDNDSYMSLRSP